MEALIKYCITLTLCDYIVKNYWMIDELTIHTQCQCFFLSSCMETTNFNAYNAPINVKPHLPLPGIGGDLYFLLKGHTPGAIIFYNASL